MEKDDPNINPQYTTDNKKEETPKRSAFREMLGRLGYSVWIIVMVIGGALAFLISLFLI